MATSAVASGEPRYFPWLRYEDLSAQALWFRVLLLWVLPLIPPLLWANAPLGPSVIPQCERAQNVYLFVMLHRLLPALVGATLVFQLFWNAGAVTPSTRAQALVTIAAVALGAGGDLLCLRAIGSDTDRSRFYLRIALSLSAAIPPTLCVLAIYASHSSRFPSNDGDTERTQHDLFVLRFPMVAALIASVWILHIVCQAFLLFYAEASETLIVLLSACFPVVIYPFSKLVTFLALRIDAISGASSDSTAISAWPDDFFDAPREPPALKLNGETLLWQSQRGVSSIDFAGTDEAPQPPVASTPLLVGVAVLNADTDPVISGVESVSCSNFLGRHSGSCSREAILPLWPAMVWTVQLYQYTFARALFLKIQTVPTLILFQTINLAQDVLVYPSRMTSAFRELQLFLFRCGVPAPLLGCHPERVSPEEFNAQVAERFFWVCLAQRVSITAFALLAAALHYNLNAPLYPFSGGGTGTAGDDAQFSELLRYFGFTLLVEWSGSTIVTILIAVVFGINVVKMGGIVLARRNLFWLCALCSVHCIADLGMSLNKVVFAPQC